MPDAPWWFETEYDMPEDQSGWVELGPGRFFQKAGNPQSVSTQFRSGKVRGAFVTVPANLDPAAARAGKFTSEDFERGRAAARKALLDEHAGTSFLELDR